MSTEFPFMNSVSSSKEELPLFKEYAWDFNADSFIYDGNGNHVLLEGNEALKVWIYKALKTERFSYLAYSWRYGIELQPFIGKVMSVQERKSELKRMIIECLMVNPWIKSVDSVTFEEVKHGEDLTTTITLTTVYGEVVLNV